MNSVSFWKLFLASRRFSDKTFSVKSQKYVGKIDQNIILFVLFIATALLTFLFWNLTKEENHDNYFWIMLVLIVVCGHLKNFKKITREIGLTQIHFEKGQIFSEPTVS